MTGRLCTQPLHAYVVGGETCEHARKALSGSVALWHTEGCAAQPSQWREGRIPVTEPRSRDSGIVRTRYDKAFCCEWLNNDVALISTKCGHVLCYHRKAQRITEVALDGPRWVEPPIITEYDLERFRVDRGGIHCIRANASQNLLACSSGRCENNNVYVLNLASEKWATVRRGRGHSDWVFCLSWVSDSSFVTGSRDTSVKLWSPHLSSSYDMQPVQTYKDVHESKVRTAFGWMCGAALVHCPAAPDLMLAWGVAALLQQQATEGT